MKTLHSKLYTTASDNISKEIENELLISDPEPNIAEATIQGAKQLIPSAPEKEDEDEKDPSVLDVE